MHLSKVQQHVSNVRPKITFAPKAIFFCNLLSIKFFSRCHREAGKPETDDVGKMHLPPACRLVPAAGITTEAAGELCCYLLVLQRSGGRARMLKAQAVLLRRCILQFIFLQQKPRVSQAIYLHFSTSY